MLCLARRVGERIVINGNIVVKILEIQGKRVRIGIEAPEGVHIRRGELEPLPPQEKKTHRPLSELFCG